MKVIQTQSTFDFLKNSKSYADLQLIEIRSINWNWKNFIQIMTNIKCIHTQQRLAWRSTGILHKTIQTMHKLALSGLHISIFYRWAKHYRVGEKQTNIANDKTFGTTSSTSWFAQAFLDINTNKISSNIEQIKAHKWFAWATAVYRRQTFVTLRRRPCVLIFGTTYLLNQNFNQLSIYIRWRSKCFELIEMLLYSRQYFWRVRL